MERVWVSVAVAAVRVGAAVGGASPPVLVPLQIGCAESRGTAAYELKTVVEYIHLLNKYMILFVLSMETLRCWWFFHFFCENKQTHKQHDMLVLHIPLESSVASPLGAIHQGSARHIRVELTMLMSKLALKSPCFHGTHQSV